MNSRLLPVLIYVVLLAMLNACVTPGPGTATDISEKQDFPPGTDTRDDERQDRPYDLLRDPSDRSLAEVAELSSNMIGYQPDVALEVLRSLETVASGQLRAMIDSQLYDPEFTEWLELSLQMRTSLINGYPIEEAAKYWVDYHYGHAVDHANFVELALRYQALFSTPAQVAILLPAEGGFAAAGNAIRDGIVSAYLDQPGGSVIRFYSSGESSETALAAYQQAGDDGATQIIGPLRIGSTRALASQHNATIPVLLLNEPGGNLPIGTRQESIVNSLSLSQSEEAAAIAGKAIEIGYRQAVVLVPDNAWGTRIETTFKTMFEQGEGQISATSRFNRAAKDHSAMLTQLLKIDESKQRKTDLQAFLGTPLSFEASRRDDFDFIFMAANPQEGRELKPLLRFHDAGDIPVYAMSRVFSGKVQGAIDQDLNDIIFPITPWQLDTENRAGMLPASVRDGAFGNLFALGQDAWQILPWLPLMQKDPDLWFPGSVGSLRLQEDGRLHREPAWAQFSAGQPVPYQWPELH